MKMLMCLKFSHDIYKGKPLATPSNFYDENDTPGSKQTAFNEIFYNILITFTSLWYILRNCVCMDTNKNVNTTSACMLIKLYKRTLFKGYVMYYKRCYVPALLHIPYILYKMDLFLFIHALSTN